MGETWVYHNNPKSKQLKNGVYLVLRILNEVFVQKFAKNVMALVFWDAKRMLLVDYLQTGKKIDSKHYCNFFDQIDGKIWEKRPDLQKKKKVIFQKTIAKISELNFELLDHPPYSPDLAPSDF